MILEFFAVIVFVLAFLVFRRIKSKWLEASKQILDNESKVKIKIYENLDLVEFEDTPEDQTPKEVKPIKNSKKGKKKIKKQKKTKKQEPLRFTRENLKKGETLEFDYPYSKSKIIITAVKGEEKKTFEIFLSS